MIRYLIISALFLVLTSCSVVRNSYAQGLHTSSNKAAKAYHDGLEAYDYLDLATAESKFKDAVRTDAKFFEAFVMLGELYTKKGNYLMAAENYRTAVHIDSIRYKPLFYVLANAEMRTGDYVNALSNYKSYMLYDKGSEQNRALSMKNIINCEFAIEAMKNPVSFSPESVGKSINTMHDEYWPSITADGQILMFTRQLAKVREGDPFGRELLQEDFYISKLTDDGWGESIDAGMPLNTSSNEGAQTLSSNGSYMYFTACGRREGLGSCDIYFSAFRESEWSAPYNLGPPVNSTAWESTPSINAEGNMLFFSSNRPGGKGRRDLWYSVITESGTWTTPVNLGDMINTDGDEMSPFIHFDGKTLYFASDGHPGMGGFDIYFSKMNDDTTWTKPKNLGYPINTFNDDMGLVIESGGQKAYFSSKRDNITGKDIFYFVLDESLRPDPVSYLKGKVSDKETGKLLQADYELINLTTNRITAKNKTDEHGNFLVCLPSGYNYGINVTKPGYLFYSDNFMFEGEHSVSEPFIKRINLSPAKVGEKMTLTNVFYEWDSWELKAESLKELDNLADLIIYNSDVIVEIGGYTDSTGTDEYNLTLSEKRALSVVNYLTEKGISPDRLKYRGYGNSSPIGDNLTSEGRRLNRRTEARIVGLKE